MLSFLTNDANSLFNIAVLIVIALGIIEGLGLLVGLSLANALDSLTPFDIDVDFDADVSSGGLTALLGWLCLNRLPLMVWLVLFLTCFAICGYLINFTLMKLHPALMAGWLSASGALLLGSLLTNKAGKRLAKLVPKNESSAISTETFAGRIATITSGNARQGYPTEASFVDNFQQKHYLLVEPIEADEQFQAGQQVVLVQKGSNGWQATRLSVE
ncbi:OB-fold-containig protein [Bowmanella sp. JS7-9]|uniref:OB-fold-containig protein n=1 Tax=Pseudobowmanella zhangzhouensis TaxID=1537679 RepID=A0ABW1XNB4_9ALTE|nr:OB-fold-containig protein [Bowmanella sp. JS7-9]TBX23718.1 hypothetical protein TK45_06380 [Bowmanella sp. JS7-9]